MIILISTYQHITSLSYLFDQYNALLNSIIIFTQTKYANRIPNSTKPYILIQKNQKLAQQTHQ